MMWYRRFFPAYKKPAIIVGFTLLVWLLWWPVSIDAAGLHIGGLTLPVRSGHAVSAFAFRSLWRGWLAVTAFLSPVLWVSVTERRLIRLLWFQLGLLVVVLVPAMMHLRSVPDTRLWMLAAAHVVVLNGFLVLLTRLMGATGAGVTIVLIQLAGPAIRYLNDFREFLPAGWASAVALTYRELPFYQKIGTMGSGGDTGALWPDLLLAIAVLAVEGVLRFRSNRKHATRAGDA